MLDDECGWPSDLAPATLSNELQVRHRPKDSDKIANSYTVVMKGKNVTTAWTWVMAIAWIISKARQSHQLDS